MKKQIAITIILLLGIAVSVFLSQRQQILKSRASLQAYNAFNVASAEAGKYVKCEGNVCETNTLNITISVRDLQALIIQEQQQAADEQPIVDDQSQNSALSSYFQSAAEVADQEDQEWARERGLPDAEAQSVSSTLISTLEKGLDVPDELWQDFGSTLGNLSQGAVDLVTSTVQQAQEKGEQKRTEEELVRIEAEATQQQEKLAQVQDQWSKMPVLERAEILRQQYGLPEGTDPEQILSMHDKAMTLGGVEFRSGPQASTVGPYGVHLNTDLSSFIITEPSKSTSEYLDAAIPDLVGIVQGAIETGKDLYELYQSMPPEKAVEVYFSLSPEARDQVNAAMLNGTKEIAGAAVQMVPFVGTNILSERVNGLNSNMAQIAEQLKDPNLTEEEREALKQEYFSSLNEVQDVKKDLVLNAAFDLAGGVPGSVLAQKAAGKGATVAKTLFVDTKTALQVAKQAGTEGLEGVWVGGRQLAADERGSWDVFGLLGEEGKKTIPQTLPQPSVLSTQEIEARARSMVAEKYERLVPDLILKELREPGSHKIEGIGEASRTFDETHHSSARAVYDDTTGEFVFRGVGKSDEEVTLELVSGLAEVRKAGSEKMRAIMSEGGPLPPTLIDQVHAPNLDLASVAERRVIEHNDALIKDYLKLGGDPQYLPTTLLSTSIDELTRQAQQEGRELADFLHDVLGPSIGGTMLERTLFEDVVRGKASSGEIMENAIKADMLIAFSQWAVPWSRSAPEDVKKTYDVFRYNSSSPYNTFPLGILVKARSKGLIDEGRARIVEALITHDVRVQDARRSLDETAQAFNILDRAAAKQGVDTTKFPPVSKVLDTDKFHVLTGEKIDEIFPDDPAMRTAAGVYIPNEGNVILRSTSTSSFIHEFCHRGCAIANPNYAEELIEIFGSQENMFKVQEGFTEKVTRIAEGMTGKNLSSNSYDVQVKMVDRIVDQMVEHSGITYNQAYAKVVEAQRGGFKNIKEIIKLAGGQGGVQEIVDSTPRTWGNVIREVAITSADEAIAKLQAEREINSITRAGKTSSQNPQWKFGIGEVFAQENDQQDSLVNSSQFEFLVKKNLAKMALERVGEISNEHIESILKRDVLTPKIYETGNDTVLTTGRIGTAEGEIRGGRYLVDLSALQGSDIKAPSFVEVKAGTIVVPIGIREGSGKVEKTAGLSGGVDGGETAKVKVAAFYDENGNGNWDGREKALPWAGIQVTLSKVIQEKTIYLKEGWNLITLPSLPVTSLTAKGLLVGIAKQGGSASAVSTLENGVWKSYVMQDNQSYSMDNFTLEPGKAYFVNASKRSTFSFTGQEFVSPVKLFLKQGWNAVGFPILSRQFKARDLGAKEEFTIEENKGYLLKLDKEIDFSP